MFSRCASLQELNISSFRADNIESMEYMFSKCYSLINLNIGNFNFENKNNKFMFSGCKVELKQNIYEQNKNIDPTVFDWDYSDNIE